MDKNWTHIEPTLDVEKSGPKFGDPHKERAPRIVCMTHGRTLQSPPVAPVRCGARSRDPFHFPDETTLLSVAVARLSTVASDDGRERRAARREGGQEQEGRAGGGRSLPQLVQFCSVQLGELSHGPAQLASLIEHAIAKRKNRRRRRRRRRARPSIRGMAGGLRTEGVSE